MAYQEILSPRGHVPDGYVVVKLPDEIDLLNVSEVSDMLLTVLNRGAAGVVADMSSTRFCDAAGCRALMRASRRAQLLETWVRAVIPSPSVRRVFRLIGADQLIPVCTTLNDALTAAARADTRAQRARPGLRQA
jgi:anti-sigma B factor antagonist